MLFSHFRTQSLRVVPLYARAASGKHRLLCTGMSSGTTVAPPKAAAASTSPMWNFFLRVAGFNSQESRDDRLAMITFLKCHKHARRPEFRDEFGVAPTFHATFQLAGLHVWMCHVRMRLEDPKRGNHVASELFEHWWHQTMLDMKEEGVHDFLQISAHLKDLQQGFRGGAKAYDDALKADDTMGEMRSALFRNVYFSEQGKDGQAIKLSGYVEQQLVQFMSMKSEAFMCPEPGVWDFARPVASAKA